MPKVKISEYSSTANSNTDVASVNIDEGCAPSGINNAIRAVMGHLKDFQAGTSGDAFNGATVGAHNGTVGATTPAAGTFTTLSATGNVTLGDAAADTVTVNGTTNFVVAPTVGGVGQNGFKNRIINGAMVIDQRNAGAAITVAAGGSGYGVDRFYCENFQSGTMTAQQSSTAPAGFVNSLIHTVTVTDTPAAGDYLFESTSIEGLNMADFGWGTANAQTVTLSFWVRSSVTGTYGIGLRNSAGNRSYVATYTINAANTWEQKTVNIAGDTSGTWLTTNGLGVRVFWDLGSGSNFNGTSNSWNAGSFWRTSGCVNWISNSGATFYITGVQLEKGSTATSFDYRPYSTELALCQRYLPAYNFTAANQNIGSGFCYGAGAALISVPLPVFTRVAPTGVSVTGTFNTYTAFGGNSGNFSSVAFTQATNMQATLNCSGGSGLVAGNGTILLSPASNSQILFNGCEL